ncbi:MAG: ATP-binding cassette domain-containing protein [Dehalococcoidia bacterium]
MIDVTQLTKYYADHIAVDDLTFHVQKGEILGFLGPNGAGKSTTMRILTGFIPPSAGTASIDGFDVMKESLQARRRIGYLPENTPLYTDLTVRSYLHYMARLRGAGGKALKSRIDDLMVKCRVDDVATTIIGKLSKGYRQRVGLAQALVHDPPVLILDEPTAGLDPRQNNETRRLIRSLAGDHTIILSSHILPEVSQTCQRVVIINEGRLVAEDTPEGLTTRLRASDRLLVQVRGPVDEVIAILGGMPDVLQVTGDQNEPGRLFVDCAPDSDPREEIAAEIVKRGWGLRELRPVGMSLEEIFLKLTTEEAAEQPQEAAA